MKVLYLGSNEKKNYLGSNEKKNLGKDLNKIEARFAE